MKLQNKQSSKNKEKAENSCIFQEIKRKKEVKKSKNIEKRGENIAILDIHKLYNSVISRSYIKKIKKTIINTNNRTL